MSSVHSYTFDSLSRIGDDVCGVSEREMQNENFGSYSVQSYFAKNCGRKTKSHSIKNCAIRKDQLSIFTSMF